MALQIQSAAYSEEPMGTHTHYHDCHQLLYIVSGQVEVTVDGTAFSADAGSVVLFSRFEEHSVKPVGDTYHRYTLRLTPRTEERFASILVNRARGFRRVLHAPETESLFSSITEEVRQDRPWREEQLEALLRQLLVSICRKMPEAALAADTPGGEVVRKLQRRFESRYAESVSLAELAAEYHLSPSYLSHLFKQITGASVMGYLQDCRLTAAKNLLAATNLSVGEVVEQCGFKDNSNFSQLFRRETGLTPSAFRRKHHRG